MRLLLALALTPLFFAQDPPDEPQGPPEDPALKSLAAKCGRQVEWRKDLAVAMKEAKRDGRLVFGYVYDRSRSSRFGNKFKDDFLKAGPFIDADLVWTLNRKFIPLRLYLDNDAIDALTLVEETGKRALKLNDVTIPGFLFITPDGRIVSKFDGIAVASSELIFRVCRNVLVKHPEFDKPGLGLVEAREASLHAPADLRERYKLGLEHLKDGLFEDAIGIFDSVVKDAPKQREAVESLYRKATAYRRLRKVKEALEAIHKARDLNREVGAKIDGDMMLEEALLEIRQGHADPAEKLIREALEKYPKSNRAPEMAYLLGAICALGDRDAESQQLWSGLTKSNPESPWAWKAASELLGRGPLANGWEDLEWLPEEALTGDPTSTERKRPPEERPQAIREGVDFLIRKQRNDGSWAHVKGQFAFPESIAIIGALALWECRDIQPDANRKAREKAVAYFENWMTMKRSPQGMGIWPWELGLHYYLRMARDAAGDERKKFLAKAEECFDGVKKGQAKDGSWTYGGGPTSFVSAAPLISMKEMKDFGIEIPAPMVNTAFESLQSMKDPERDTYWYTHRASDEFDHGAPEGAAGRGAVCYQAEYVWNRCDDKTFEWAMKMFMDHRIRLMRVRKTTDWHAGKYANAPYFFFYDYYYASEAILKLKPELRTAYAKDITKDLLSIGEIDGGWIDWHIAGKSYGAAMAIMCLKNCEKAETLK